MLDDVLNGQRQHVAFVAPDARRELHRRDAHDRAVADAHEVAPRHVVVRQQRKDIDIDDLRTDDHRLARIVVERVEPLLVTLGQFEFQLRGSPRHLPLEVLPHGPQVAFQHRNDHLQQPSVLLLGLPSDAGPLAVPEVVLQADRVFAPGDRPGVEVEFAGAQRHHLADEIEHAVLHHHRTVGSEILRPVAREGPRGLHAGEMLPADHDPRIGLVILQQDVVTRLEGLYQRIFEQQGVRFATHDDMADRGDLLHQHAHLGAVLLRLHEIGRHPFAQALGLAHVDDRPRAVQKLVDARRQRQQGDLLPKAVVLGSAHTFGKCSNFSAKFPAGGFRRQGGTYRKKSGILFYSSERLIFVPPSFST